MSAQLPTAGDLQRVVCPACHQPLRVDAGAICCDGCGRRYPVVDGIPVLLVKRIS